jgi:hypothetical protein
MMRLPLLRRQPRARTTMRAALEDPELLGNMLEGDSWKAWRTLLIAAMGEPLTTSERELFTQLTGREREPLQRVDELVCVAGRRGGKSRACSTLAAYFATLVDHSSVLVPGEVGTVLLVAPSQRQSKIVLNHCEAAFEQSPILKQLLWRSTADVIELRNRIQIEVRPASYRSLRGPTYLCAILDESAFFYSDEFSVNADSEVLGAVRPGLATTGGITVIASSPYARRGILWSAYNRDYGPDGDPAILVAQGGSRVFNPTLSERFVERELQKDPAFASAEYLAQFRSDLELYVSLEIVQACIGDYYELAPAKGVRYHAFTDFAGGSGKDSAALAISYRDRDGRIIISCIRETQPPFSPAAVIEDYAHLCKSYRIKRITGDRFGGEFPREAFRQNGLTYEPADKPKSAYYVDLLPLLNSGRISLPKSERLVAQLCSLERNTARTGKDQIDHPRGPSFHDDLANSVAGATHLASTKTYNSNLDWIHGASDVEGGVTMNFDTEWQRRQFAQYVASGGYTRPY